MTVDQILANLPYSSGAYASNESASVYDQSTTQILAPDGTASITETIDYDVESGYDYLVIMDAAGNTIENLTGSATDYVAVIPGNYALIGIDSDSSVQRSGYSITDVVAQ